METVWLRTARKAAKMMSEIEKARKLALAGKLTWDDFEALLVGFTSIKFPVNYYSYIQSPEWKAKADAAKKRAGNRCQVCNRHKSQVVLDAHHRTYERLGNERPSDITVLCRGCHEIYEANKK